MSSVLNSFTHTPVLFHTQSFKLCWWKLFAALCEAGTCSGNGDCLYVSEYETQCSCDDGYTDSDCSTDIDDCASDPCANGGTCEDYVDGFHCICDSPWTGDTCGEGNKQN